LLSVVRGFHQEVCRAGWYATAEVNPGCLQDRWHKGEKMWASTAVHAHALIGQSVSIHSALSHLRSLPELTLVSQAALLKLTE
jgi:hypothetical protein